VSEWSVMRFSMEPAVVRRVCMSPDGSPEPGRTSRRPIGFACSEALDAATF